MDAVRQASLLHPRAGLRDPARRGELRLLAARRRGHQERIREYDFGPGRGGAVELYVQRKNLPLVTARYRYSHLKVSNGSIYTGETASGAAIGLDSDDIHQANVKLEIPIRRSLTIGADGSVFLRRSRYNVTEDTPEFGEAGRRTITQRNPEIRAFVAWTYNH